MAAHKRSRAHLAEVVDYYLPGFKACVLEGRALGIMCSYNAVSRCTGGPHWRPVAWAAAPPGARRAPTAAIPAAASPGAA